MYAQLESPFRDYVDSLLQHARTALWPERRAALDSFRRGIAKSDAQDLRQAAAALGASTRAGDDPAETLYRVLLTAYLERLGDEDISNPDQAALYLRSLDPRRRAAARNWFDAHPEHSVTKD